MRTWGVAVLGLVLMAGTVRADDIREARRLLISKDIKERLRGLAMLGRIDSKSSVQALVDAVRRAAREMDHLAPKVAKLEEDWFKWYFTKLVYRSYGLTSSDEYRDASRKEVVARKKLQAMTAVMEADLKIVRSAAGILDGLRSPAAIEKLESGAQREPNTMVRLLYVGALGHESRARSVPVLAELLSHKDGRIRAAAARALIPHVRREGALPALEAATADKHWAVRLGAYQAIAGAPFAKAVQLLVKAAQEEEGEIALAVDSYLETLTGYSFPQRTGFWKTWYEKHKGAINAGIFKRRDASLKGGAERKTVAMFFRIPIESKRVVFALDFSGSMGEDVEIKDESAKKIMRAHKLKPTRLGYAQAEFIRVMQTLPAGAYFNVVGYNSKAKLLSGKMVKVTRSSRKRAINWVRKLKTDDLTNIYGALETAFRDMFGSGGRSGFDQIPDTIVFLTDGAATAGRFQEMEEMRDLVRMWSRTAEVVIHTVGIGKGHDTELLSALAEETGGYYVDLTKGLKSFQPRRRKLPSRVSTPQATGEGFGGMLKALASEDHRERKKALAALEAKGAGALAAAVKHIVPLLGDLDDDVQKHAERLVQKIGAAAVPALIKHAQDEDTEISLPAMRALGKMGATAAPAVTALAKILGGEDFFAAEAAAVALGQIGPAAKAAIPALEKAAKDSFLAEAAKTALKAIR